MSTSFNNTGLTIPNLTSTQRDSIVSPSIGQFFYNTTINKYQIYTGTFWAIINF